MAGSEGTIVITGANGTLGSALVSKIVSTIELATTYHGLYTVRDANAAPALRSALRESSPGVHNHAHDVLALDLTNLASIRTCAGTINTRVASGEIPRIRALILNAGYLEFTSQSWTEDGFDTSFAANYLGHWLLTLMLLQSMDPVCGRIVVVGSESHDPYNAKSKAAFNHDKWMLFIHDSTEPIAKGTWSTSKEDPSIHAGFRRYGASKFCLAMMIGELQGRLDTDPLLHDVCVLGIDPGSIATSLTRRGPWLIRILIFKIIVPLLVPILAWLQPNGALRTLAMGTSDILAAALASSPPLNQRPKEMYLYGSTLGQVTAEAKDPKKRALLWRESIEYAQVKEGDTVLSNWK